MFRPVEKQPARTSCELIALATESFRSGRLRPGDRFPSPDEISKITGVSLIECLDVVTSLLKSGSIQQMPSGRLSISRPLAS